MKDKVIIFGVNMFSAVVYRTITEENQAEVLCFTLNKEYISEAKFEDLDVVPFEELEEHFDMSSAKVVITVGYGKMNGNRAKVYESCKLKGFNVYTFISDNAIIYTKEIGEGSIILPMAFVGPYVNIGKCCIVWNMTSISHHSVVGDFCHFAGGTMIGGGTNFGLRCFIGMHCTFKNGINIADKTFVSANSYVSENTEENAGYSGIPAKRIPKVTSDLLIRFVK